MGLGGPVTSRLYRNACIRRWKAHHFPRERRVSFTSVQWCPVLIYLIPFRYINTLYGRLNYAQVLELTKSLQPIAPNQLLRRSYHSNGISQIHRKTKGDYHLNDSQASSFFFEQRLRGRYWSVNSINRSKAGPRTSNDVILRRF